MLKTTEFEILRNVTTAPRTTILLPRKPYGVELESDNLQQNESRYANKPW